MKSLPKNLTQLKAFRLTWTQPEPQKNISIPKPRPDPNPIFGNSTHKYLQYIFFLFQLTLTSHVTEEDFQLGYSMSGHLERSFEKYISFQITHLAFVRRRDYFQDPNSDPNKSKPEVHQLASFLTGSKSSNTAGTSGSNTGSSSLTSQSKTARFVKNLCRVYLSSK